MMRTLTHEPLSLAGALLLLVALVAAFSVWVTLRIQARSGRAGAGTECVEGALGAAGPGVVKLVSTTPGPDTKTRPSAMGGGKSAGSATNPAKAKGAVTPEAADMAPEGAPAALSGATPDPIDEAIDLASALLIADDWKPTDRLDVGTEAEWWLAIGAPEGWAPPPVVPGRSES